MEQRHATKEIPTQIKNPELVEQRHRQIVDAAVQLFINHGFHKTTTRQIARSAGISIGSLYEYIASKEDILYLVCDAIHAEVESAVSEAMARASGGRSSLAEVIREYFLVCNRMSDHILLIYQETQSLPPQWRKKVLENEVRITGIFMEVLERLISSGELPHLSERSMLHTTFLSWAICGRFGAGFLPDITVLKIISSSKPNLFLEYQGIILNKNIIK
jgi:AcrR family transcriptional regulator